MQTIAVLLQDYRGKLQAAAAITPNEQRLCSLLTQELANLENAVSGNDPELIQASLTTQAQLFGRSFLSGPAGEQAEKAFNQVRRCLSRGT